MARGEDQEVTVFNMSFLDVFCCTVGALIFILFIQVLRTRDMVERRELESTLSKLEQARQEFSETEKAREAMQRDYKQLQESIATAKREKTKLEEELDQAKGRVDAGREELKKKDSTIQQLMAELKKPRPAAASSFGRLPRQVADEGGGTGRGMEAQKTARGQYLLGNLETRAVVCSAEGLYLGLSRESIPIHDSPDLRPLFREFLRFHDPRQEGLWRTVWKDGGAAWQTSFALEASEKSHVGKGLVVHEDTWMAKAGQMAAQQETKAAEIDTNSDGTKETRFEDTDSDGVLDVKRVNVDSDPFYEEVYLDYDAATHRWGRLLADTDGDNQHDILLHDTSPGDSDYETMYVLPNLRTGNAVFRYEDNDNDGYWDRKYENTDLTNESWEKTYLLFSPRSQRWAAISVDTTGNGNPDVLWRDTDMSNDDWEEKLVDTNGDGKWDIYWKDLDPRDSDWEAKFTLPKGDMDIWLQCELDSDSDGTFDTMLKDTDGDGKWDEEYSYDNAGGKWLKKDT